MAGAQPRGARDRAAHPHGHSRCTAADVAARRELRRNARGSAARGSLVSRIGEKAVGRRKKAAKRRLLAGRRARCTQVLSSAAP